jgi:hypothetical protein
MGPVYGGSLKEPSLWRGPVYGGRLKEPFLWMGPVYGGSLKEPFLWRGPVYGGSLKEPFLWRSPVYGGRLKEPFLWMGPVYGGSFGGTIPLERSCVWRKFLAHEQHESDQTESHSGESAKDQPGRAETHLSCSSRHQRTPICGASRSLTSSKITFLSLWPFPPFPDVA